MQQAAYDPEAYGWSQLSKAQKKLVKNTVQDQVRKDHVIYYASAKSPAYIPAYTADGIGDAEFVVKALQIIAVFGGARRNVRLVCAYWRNALGTPVFSLAFDAAGAASFRSVALVMAQTKPVLAPWQARIVEEFSQLPLGNTWKVLKLQREGDALKARRLGPGVFNVQSVFKVGIATDLLAARPDVEGFLLARLTPGLASSLPAGGPLEDADREALEADLDMITSDLESAALPKLGEEAAPAALTDDELMTLFADEAGPSKPKGKARPAARQPRRPQQPDTRRDTRQVFVAPAKVAVPRKRTGEMLEMIGYRGQRDYRAVCPERGQEPIQSAYRRAYAVGPADGPEETRDRRNRALACGLLRQRVQAALAGGDEGHRKPISLAYALATAASHRLVRDQAATADNRLIDSWLALKGPLVHPEEVDLLRQ